MRHHEIICPKGTDTHPYVATVFLDPATFARFQQLTEDRDDVKVLGVDRSTSEHWTVFAGCASKKGARLLESNFGRPVTVRRI